MSEEINVLRVNWNNRNDMIAGLSIENKELHTIIKLMLGIKDNKTYVPDVYIKMFKNMQGKLNDN